MDDEHSIYEGRIIMELKLMHIYESLASSLGILEQVQPWKVLMGFLELCKLEELSAKLLILKTTKGQF